MKTKLLFVKRRFLIVLLFALALTFACLIAGATTSVAYAAGEHTDHSGWNTLSGTYYETTLSAGNYVLTGDLTLIGGTLIIGNEGQENTSAVICLNGHKIWGNDMSIRFSGNCKDVTICDCTGKGQISNAIFKSIANINDITLIDCSVSHGENVDVTTNLNNVYFSGGRLDGNHVSINEGTTISKETVADFTTNRKKLYINGGTVNCDLDLSGSGYYINGGIIYGSISDSGWMYTGGGSTDYHYGNLYITGGTFYGTTNVNYLGNCDISSGTFYGAINVSGGTCNITGGTFSSPINVSDGTCNITGGTIKTSQYYNDDPGTPQGAVVVSGDGVCNIGGTAQISGNRVDYGGAVCVNGGTCTISGNNITKNNAPYGAVYVVDGTCTIESDAVISENKSFSNGGGVYVAGGECKISGTITNNEATAYGGGVYVAGGECTITGTITNNKVQANGGGVYVAGGECLVAGGVQENTATKGGGVYIAGGNCTLSSSKCLIRKNTATYDGGGVYVDGGTCSIYAQSIVQENTATHNGGGVYVAGGECNIYGTITNNEATACGGGVYLSSNASLTLNGSIVNNSTATGSNPGNGGGIYCGSGCSLTLNSSSVITGNKAYGQGGGIYLNGTAANPCTVTFSGNATVNSNTEYRNGGTAVFNNVYALNSEITFNNANALSSVQQNSIVLNTSSCTLADGTWETDQIGPYFELQDGGEIIIAGGYYSTDPAQLFTIADTARVVQIDENSGDNNYDAAYPWAVYPVHFEYMSGWQNGSLVYDGQPIEKDTDFTLYLENSHDMPFNYWYKAQGANDSAYVLGLPADAGTYTVKVGALYLNGSYKEYWECTFDVTIAKADYVMSGITFEPDSVTYDGEAHSLEIAGTLPDGVTVTYEGNGKVNAGTYTVTAKFAGDYANYNTIDDRTAMLTIAKAMPVYTTPENLTACIEHKLADVILPVGWTWEDSTLSVGEAGEKQFKAIFTPEDTSNYNTVEESVTVTVTAHTGGTATCTDKAVCSVCGMKYGELTPHVFDQKVTTEKYLASEATCTHKATYYYSCVCGEKDTETFEYGELAPHVFDQKVATAEYLASEATCTQKATYYYSCVCGEKDTETFEYGELAPHVFDQKVATAEYLASEATCTHKATYYYSCVCGEKGTETFEYGELAPHVFDQKVTTEKYLASEATCTHKATYYYSCVCGEKGTETFEHGELAEHTAVEIPAVEATCTQSGMTAGSKCSVCGEILVAPEEIAPLGHIDENGDELCDRCGFDMSIPKFTIKVTGGTIEGAIGSTVIVEENGSVTVVASEAPEGKEFKGWSIDGGETIISAEAAYTFTASEDTVLTAVFADKQSDVKPGGEITPENPEGLSGGAIAGIVIGSVLGALIIAYGVCALLYKKKILKGAFFEKIYPFIKD